MIGLGLRLGVAGGRRAVAMAVVTTVAVAIGSALLLLALTVAPAVQGRADRTAWMDVAFGVSTSDTVAPDSPVPHTAIATSVDTFHSDSVEVVAISGAGAGAPVPPGLPRLPGIGEVLVSPALSDLMRDAPELADRYGRVVGLVGSPALPGPEALLAAQGVPPQVAALQGVAVTAFPDHGRALQLTGVVRLLLLLGAVAMVAPVALLVALATRLSAATRDRRLAALRLAGATSREVALLAAAESLIAGVGGVLAGTLLFFAIRPLATHVTYDGGRWFSTDLNPGLVGFAAVLVGVPLVTAAATQATLSRVRHSPLGVVRRSKPKPSRPTRLVPLLLAVPLLWAALRSDGTAGAAGGQGKVVLVCFCVLLLALLYAGPWLTRAVGLALAQSNGPARLLAGRRLADDPRAGFRAVSGVVLAILVTTLFAATTPAAAESLRDTRVTGQKDNTAQATLVAASPDQSAALLREVRSLPGVPEAALVYEGLVQDGTAPATLWIGDCARIAAATRLTGVPCEGASAIVAENRRHLAPAAGAELRVDNLFTANLTPPGRASREGEVSVLVLHPPTVATMPAQVGVDVPAVILSPQAAGPLLAGLRPTLMVLRYNDEAALERVRSLVLRSAPGSSVATRETTYDGYSSDVRRLYRVLTIATLGAFGVAGLGLIISVATGLLERRRPFALLRATGTPLRTLQRTALLEAIVPLVVMSVLAAGLGALVGHWTVVSSGQSRQLPWLGLTAPVAGGLVTALLLVVGALPLVGPTTRLEETRFE